MLSMALGTLMAAAGAATATGAGETAAFATRPGVPPVWQRPVAPAGAPNILLILLDDVGFGAAGAFGGPVATPTFDAVAREGVRYNRFHTTALCSPTRAALLTGRNHHRVGFGDVSGSERPVAGYTGIWPHTAATVARGLRDNGYSTAAIGKWHNTPNWEASPVGPFDQWPTGLGFEYFYGFMAGEMDAWRPILYRNTVSLEAPDKDYNFNEDMAGDAISWLHMHQAPGKPWFLYYAPGATHAPIRGRLRGLRHTAAALTGAGTACGRRYLPGRKSWALFRRRRS